MKNPFSFERSKSEKPENTGNAEEKMLRSEFMVHKELVEGAEPRPVLEVMNKYRNEIVRVGMDFEKTQRLMVDEYQVLARMDLPKEEVESELERRMMQLLPRKQ